MSASTTHVTKEISFSGPMAENREEKSINDLPNEILDLVFSYLGEKDFHSTVQVNKFWQEFSVTVVKRTNLKLIKKYMNFLKKNMESKHKLDVFNENETGFVNVKSVNDCNFSLLIPFKEKLIKLFKILGDGELVNLMNLSKDDPDLTNLERILDLARFEKSIDLANSFSEIFNFVQI